jgi:hypothetical protein
MRDAEAAWLRCRPAANEQPPARPLPAASRTTVTVRRQITCSSIGGSTIRACTRARFEEATQQ